MPINLTLVRHAQGHHNVDAIISGENAYKDPKHKDAQITIKGVEQAIEGFNKLKNEYFDIIMCSSSKRCRQTLELVYPDAINREVLLFDWLMEPQGKHICNQRERKEIIVKEHPNWNWTFTFEDSHFEQSTKVESEEDFINRIKLFIDYIKNEYPNKKILIVTHYTWIKHFSELYLGKQIELENVGILNVNL